MSRVPTSLLAACIALLLAPAVAAACSLVAEPPLRPHIAAADLRPLRTHHGERAAWVRSTSWVTSPMAIRRQVQLPGRRPVYAAFAQQRSLALIVSDPGGGRYIEDDDPATSCALAGQPVWSDTKLLLRETRRAIFVVAITRRTQGDATGCGMVIGSCDDITLRTVRLDARIGARQLYAVRF